MTYRQIYIMWNNWFADSIVVASLLPITANMTVTFRVGDYGAGHIVEAGIDGFEVVDLGPNSAASPSLTVTSLSCLVIILETGCSRLLKNRRKIPISSWWLKIRI